MIKLHNSVTRMIEDFHPQDAKFVSMYVCGPTVYGPAHIGNARPAIVFDVLFRLLRHVYGENHVHYARNITDVDDKIIQATNQQGKLIHEITEPAYEAYQSDLVALGNLQPTHEPKATHYVSGMVEMIKELIEKNHAYVVDGEVFFHVPSNPYPGIANHTHTEAGSRVKVDTKKRDPRDFVLWKPSKSDEPSWPSPWGAGRPGWHIECSTMIRCVLGSTIDIHGGGQDLRFPHHEAECAQSQCAHDGAPLSRYWLHNGLLTVEGEKMSKSRGNVILLNELFKKYPAESVRYYFLSSHYRSPLDFSWKGLEAAHTALSRLYEAMYRHDDQNYAEFSLIDEEFLKCLADDLNTPNAIATLHRISAEMTRGQDAAKAKARLLFSGRLLGLFNHTPQQWRTLGVDKELVERLITQRNQARSNRDYQKADKIRFQLMEMGILIADSQEGTDWKRV